MIQPAENISEEDHAKLMNLPEHILLDIMSYMSDSFLLFEAPKVCMEWKRLSRSPVLWSGFELVIDTEAWLAPGRAFFLPSFVDQLRFIAFCPRIDILKLILWPSDKVVAKRLHTALLFTPSMFSILFLKVKTYGPEIMLFLQRHPELKMLLLNDGDRDDDCYAAGVASTVGHLAHNCLTKLNLSQSMLMHMPKAGQLLASPAGPPRPDEHLNPAVSERLDKELLQSLEEQASTFLLPEQLEAQNSQGALDLRDENEDCEGPKGLQMLIFSPFEFPSHIEPSSPWISTARNLSAFIHAHKHTLRKVAVSLPHQDVWMALAECTKLEELHVACDPAGSDLCAMLSAMRPTLRDLWLDLPATMDPKALAAVFETLCCRAPQLRTLSLSCRTCCPTQARPMMFPGFSHLRALLVGGDRPASLRELFIQDMGPIGRQEIRELAAMAAAHGGLSLRELHLVDCACSVDGSSAKCKDGAELALKAAVPELDYPGLNVGLKEERWEDDAEHEPCEHELDLWDLWSPPVSEDEDEVIDTDGEDEGEAKDTDGKDEEEENKRRTCRCKKPGEEAEPHLL